MVLANNAICVNFSWTVKSNKNSKRERDRVPTVATNLRLFYDLGLSVFGGERMGGRGADVTEPQSYASLNPQVFHSTTEQHTGRQPNTHRRIPLAFKIPVFVRFHRIGSA